MKWIEVKVAQSCPTLCDPMDYTVHEILLARILEWVASLFSRGIFPTQGLNPGLLHWRQILYQLSHKGSPIILEWVAYPFSGGSSWPRNLTGVSCIAGGYFTNWAIGKVKMIFSDIWFVKMLFPPLGYLFIFFTALKNKVLNFYNVLVYFFFITCVFTFISKKPSPNLESGGFMPNVSLFYSFSTYI